MQNGNEHWVFSASTKGVIYLAYGLRVAPTESPKKQTSEIYHDFTNDNNGTPEIELIKGDMQAHDSDCGVFTIAFGFEFAVSGKVSTADYFLPAMRKHLIKCYDTMSIQPFQRKRLYKKLKSLNQVINI